MTVWDSFKCCRKLNVGGHMYRYFSLKVAERHGLPGISKLPFSIKILLENLLRHEDGQSVTKQDIIGLVQWAENKGKIEREIAFRPARVLMQDFTGVPAIVDLASMRNAMAQLKGDPHKINPLIPVDLVIDHSVIVDVFGTSGARARNEELEYVRNGERYEFLKWGQKAFNNFRVVPPGTGICHQVNLEYLAQVVWSKTEQIALARHKYETAVLAYPDTLVGTDSHTTMVNGLAVLGWGVGGIEAEAAMLGQPLTMLLPEVIGVHLTGKLREGCTATDLVLHITQLLRTKGVVNKFVEFYGPGLNFLSLPDRATVANMAPEYGATCGFFPIDLETLRYLKGSNRTSTRIDLVEKYAKVQGLFRNSSQEDPVFSDIVEVILEEITPCVAGPKRPESKVSLELVAPMFSAALETEYGKKGPLDKRFSVEDKEFDLGHGDVVIAAITSCTNTSNPDVLIAAGLMARRAQALGLQVKPWVKTSLTPGSPVVAEYLKESGLQDSLNYLGFQVVGFGCATCIGNSGPLFPEISQTIHKENLIVASVLSGNRNFEGRVSPDAQANYLASPPLVIAYALAGSMKVDLTKDPLGYNLNNEPIYLSDLWPSVSEVKAILARYVNKNLFRRKYAKISEGDQKWNRIAVPPEKIYRWGESSTYVSQPPYFEGMTSIPAPLSDIKAARILALLGDKITTDHISPAGNIKVDSPAGKYLMDHGVSPADFNQYGTRRGNHEVMVRGTLANIRLKNYMLADSQGQVPEGGLTRHWPSGEQMFIYDASMRYQQEGVPLILFAGKEYGNGSSRDWAAKGVKLLGVRAVVAESFERIHRSNLVGMGVLPLKFKDAVTWKSLGLKGDEQVSVRGIDSLSEPRQEMTAEIHFADGRTTSVPLLSCIATVDELAYFKHGGILPYVLRQLCA